MSGDRQEPPGDDADATRALPPDRGPGGADADATRALPPTGDRTARQQPADRTAPLPAAWSGRAGVPPPRPVGYQEAGTEWYTEEQAGRRWWMPILLGILALLLIALIGVGVWLALRAADRGPEPSPSLTPGPTTAPATTAAPTSAAPTTQPPTTPPTTTAAARVPMPPLVGLPEATARAVLDRLGVDYRVVTRTSDRPAGTVIETDPGAGEAIAEGDQVTVVVAEAAAPTTGAGTPTPAPSASGTP
ncbi:PASTA domain-containing protein [Micromonospora sp. 4G57]|uniref:PASTA domain-containing protein n=1 Tax=Micromonospora sicca TaxID=2202420 RepID=A0ABU5JA08_9ACTN|nr:MULTISPECIES: PASTA domain-containing protein [unclassified Micromonospora]MDZ5444240.1 PASTA domain-containing protein [Micromonospora sp. 4G57]MDZ5489406.1 PASTA domain-containing protein [Micromonospora sp. 4G53]